MLGEYAYRVKFVVPRLLTVLALLMGMNEMFVNGLGAGSVVSIGVGAFWLCIGVAASFVVFGGWTWRAVGASVVRGVSSAWGRVR